MNRLACMTRTEPHDEAGSRRRNHGFSLFELVVAMAVVGILLAIAIPSFNYVTSSNRVASEVNGLLGDLQFARAEAIKEGQTVTACSSANGTTCSTTNATSWNQGWIVFSDANGNGLVDGSDYVLRKQPQFSGNDTFSSSNNVSYITFNRIGFATTASVAGNTVSTRITLHTATPNSGSTRCMNVYTSGLIIITPFDNGVTCS